LTVADSRQASRIRHGLIPVLVAMRVKAERERRMAEAVTTPGQPAEKPKKRRGWFG